MMLMLGFTESTYQLALENSVCLYGNVMRREDGNVLRRALNLDIVGQKKKGRPKSTWNKQVRKKALRLV